MKIHREVPNSFSDSDLIIGDSALVLKHFPSDFVDLTVTSPPYDNLRDYKGFCFDFETIAREIYRVTKTGGVVVWVVADATVDGSETGTSFRQALFFMECGFRLHDTMIWKKPTFSAVGSLATRYAPVFEYMFVFSKGAPSIFNPIKDRKNSSGTISGTIRQKDGSLKRMSSCGKKYTEYGQRFNVWEMCVAHNKDAFHPAPFPEALAADHIKSWSDPGALVFDPFSGSGTTASMAEYLKRRFLGIEISEEYALASRKRVGSEQVLF